VVLTLPISADIVEPLVVEAPMGGAATGVM